MTPRAKEGARAPRLTRTLLRTQADERLMELAGEGSDAAFSEIFRRHQANLVAFAGTIAPPGYADDVVQDAMVKARAALARGDRPEFPKAWLFRIVRNTALNERRGWREHDEIDESIDGVERPPQAFERRSEIKNLVVALNDLPDAQRQALVQREMEGRGHDEIAAALDVSPGAVRQLIHRARTTLRAGAGALVPATLLRAAMLSGGGEQAAAGAAAGLSLTGVKVGLGALLATGAVVAGADVATTRHKDKAEAPTVEARTSSPAAAAPVAAAASTPGAEKDLAVSSEGALTTGQQGSVKTRPAELRSGAPDGRPLEQQGGGQAPPQQQGAQQQGGTQQQQPAYKPPSQGGGYDGQQHGAQQQPPPPPQ